MDQATIIAFLRALDAEKITVGGGWVRASCPLAAWDHEKGTDSTPSFGVRITSESEESHWHCFTCKSGGSLGKLINRYTWTSGTRPPGEAVAILLAAEQGVEDTSVEVATSSTVPDKFARLTVQSVAQPPPVPEHILVKFSPLGFSKSRGDDLVMKWLTQKRGLSEDVVKAAGLRLHPNPLGVVFPVARKDGSITDLRVRALKPRIVNGAKKKVTYRLSPELTGSKIPYKAVGGWFGSQLLESCNDQVTLVEGELDCLRLRSLGVKNVLACCGSLTKEHMDSLYARLVVLGFDNDDTGRRYVRYAKRRLTGCRVWELDWAVVGRKDAGDLASKAELIRVLAAKTEYEV